MKKDWFESFPTDVEKRLTALLAEGDGEVMRESVAPTKECTYTLDQNQIEPVSMTLGKDKVKMYSISGILLQKFARSRYEPKNWAETRAENDKVLTLSGGGKNGLKQMLQLLNHFGGQVKVRCIEAKRTENDQEQSIALGLFEVIEPAPADTATDESK